MLLRTVAWFCYLDNMWANRFPLLFAAANISKEVFHLFLCLRHLLRGGID